jgi:ATP-dependent Lhr-like helicase
VSAFDRLHPALQHHIVNSLGWKALRPLQEETIEPLLEGENAILVAPTAGGKTEAAFFPVLSRLLSEEWSGLSVVYLCPIKALLNNLEARLAEYAAFGGRSVALWHGDTPQSKRKKILSAPPNILLTTPESLEVMLISKGVDHRLLFSQLRCVVVDEVHSFAGDDRGWHLLALLERLTKLAGCELQRIGLSATIGNPGDLAQWISGSSTAPRRVLAPPAGPPAKPEIQLDWVKDLNNAARVIAGLHQGEKRLVFCDSRANVEALGTALRDLGVETFVSHSSVSLDERTRAEQAFAQGSNCVIVATSTLELGIDVGDLHRVIQVDAPVRVASFLQRMGRTGRRPGTQPNMLFLATEESCFLRAAGLIRLHCAGFVEPVVPPPLPFHILAQQIMALSLQEGGIGLHAWPEWIGGMPGFASMDPKDVRAIVAHMLEEEILFEDGGLLSFGTEGELRFGWRNFMELFSVFTSPPLFRVLHGRTEIGQVHRSTFEVKQDKVPVLVLGGRSWRLNEIDWKGRIAYVEPSKDRGRSRWLGDGQPWHVHLCHALRDILVGKEVGAPLTERAQDKLAEIRATHFFVQDGSTTVMREGTRQTWWTFAGLLANASLKVSLGQVARPEAAAENLEVSLAEAASSVDIEASIRSLDATSVPPPPVSEQAIDGLKFSEALPRELAKKCLGARLSDHEGWRAALQERIRFVSEV